MKHMILYDYTTRIAMQLQISGNLFIDYFLNHKAFYPGKPCMSEVSWINTILGGEEYHIHRPMKLYIWSNWGTTWEEIRGETQEQFSPGKELRHLLFYYLFYFWQNHFFYHLYNIFTNKCHLVDLDFWVWF